MSSILAIDTSTARGGVAVLRDGVVVFEKHFASERSHHSLLFAPLAEAIEVGGADLRAIVAGTGPGSYTGARIGIAAAQGVGLSRKVPVIGLLSVVAPEAAALPSEFVVCGDARRGKFFVARVRDHLLQGEITLLDADEFRTIRGATAVVPWFSFDPKTPLGLANICQTSPSAAGLALVASKIADETIWTLEQRPLEPHYLAAPFVTQAKMK
ncbi:MAG TPA: tRNA (adenosine(37)-N6)-threonylcarbamoyltransferase complex dimerization subunit type 1 TsaB [Verrucomicrobiaceae bacterium]